MEDEQDRWSDDKYIKLKTKCKQFIYKLFIEWAICTLVFTYSCYLYHNYINLQ